MRTSLLLCSRKEDDHAGQNPEACSNLYTFVGSAPSGASFSRQLRHDEMTTMEGTVTEVHYLVPHSWLYVEVKDEKGEPTTWAMEATGYGGLQRVGVKREDLKPGDRVKVRCHLLKDGSNGCLLGYVTPMHGDTARGNG